MKQGAIAAWSTNGLNDNTYYSMMVKALCDKYNVSIETPFKDLPDDFVEELLYGKENTLLTFEFDSKFGGMKTYQNYYEGVVVNFERRYRETNSDAMRDRLDDFMADRPCPKCKGRRLKPEVLAVKVGGKNIMEVTDLSVEDLIDYIEGLNLSEMDMHIAKDVVKEIQDSCKRRTYLGSQPNSLGLPT